MTYTWNYKLQKKVLQEQKFYVNLQITENVAKFVLLKIAITQSYTVEFGDTLTKIANQYNTTVKKLLKLNPNIVNLNQLNVGNHLHLVE